MDSAKTPETFDKLLKTDVCVLLGAYGLAGSYSVPAVSEGRQ